MIMLGVRSRPLATPHGTNKPHDRIVIDLVIEIDILANVTLIPVTDVLMIMECSHHRDAMTSYELSSGAWYGWLGPLFRSGPRARVPPL